MKVQGGGNKGTAPFIPDLGTRWTVSIQLYAVAAIPLGKETPIPTE
jgi:hypothetical protein